MRRVALLLAVLLSCDGLAEDAVGLVPRIEGQKRAEAIVAETFAETGYEMSPPIIVLWHADECLPEPWALWHVADDANNRLRSEGL